MGTIFPGGLLPCGIATNDPNASGGIGKIRCVALVLVPLTDVTTPTATFVTELYAFPDDNRIIIADGTGRDCSPLFCELCWGGTRYLKVSPADNRDEPWCERNRRHAIYVSLFD